MKTDRGELGAYGDASMSFKDIGRELGITRGGAWMAYRSAMRKLRQGKRLKQLLVLLEVAKLKGQYL